MLVFIIFLKLFGHLQALQIMKMCPDVTQNPLAPCVMNKTAASIGYHLLFSSHRSCN